MILDHRGYGARATFDCDVVVVGTGAGGAAAGLELVMRGLDVVFVEEGGHHPTSSFNPFSSESVPRLLRDGGATMIYGRPVIPYVEGRCVGGSTTINGGMSWRAPDGILERWARICRDPGLGPGPMDLLYRRAEEITCVGPQHPVSIGDDNRIMARGAARMGWRHDENHRSQDHCVGANNCVLGCPTGAKQSTLVSYMPRALGRGARLLTEVRVHRLLQRNGRCVGVQGRVVDPRTRRPAGSVTVRARSVVISAGAVQTPHLLLGSRSARGNDQLGANFLCHPNAKVLAVYPHDVFGWKGVSQWGQIREFVSEGILMAENMVGPSALGTLQPFHGKDLWELMARYNQMVACGVLVEDSTTGRVRRGPMDMPLPLYNITALDHERFLKGVRLLAELHFAMGAERVLLPFHRGPRDVRSPDQLAQVRPDRIRKTDLDLFTVHLMGTARMGARPEDSVTDTTGGLWDLPGCHVADASLFPTAIGVNPQLTIMALAARVASRVADTLGA